MTGRCSPCTGAVTFISSGASLPGTSKTTGLNATIGCASLTGRPAASLYGVLIVTSLVSIRAMFVSSWWPRLGCCCAVATSSSWPLALEVEEFAVSHAGHELLAGVLGDLVDGLDGVVSGVGQVNHGAQRFGPMGSARMRVI